MVRAQAAGSGSWLEHLPFVLLGLRSAVREDSACCPADLLYGSPLCLPADLLVPSSSPRISPSEFVDDLRDIMSRSSPMPFEYHGNVSSCVPDSLASCSHVFVRVDAVRRPLNPPYEGPFPVLRRELKSFVLNRNNKDFVVSVDHLKPAAIMPGTVITPPLAAASLFRQALTVDAPVSASPVVISAPSDSGAASPAGSLSTAPSSSPSALDPVSWPLPTQYGRRPKSIDRYGV